MCLGLCGLIVVGCCLVGCFVLLGGGGFMLFGFGLVLVLGVWFVYGCGFVLINSVVHYAVVYRCVVSWLLKLVFVVCLFLW